MDISNVLFLDIETVPVTYRYTDLEPHVRRLWNKKWAYSRDLDPEQMYAKAGIYAEFARIVCVAIGYFSNREFVVSSFSSHDERQILVAFSEFLKDRFNTSTHYLCAHNGREFDFPFLCRRFLANGLSLPRLLQLQGLKPWEIRHIDTMDLWKFGDVKNFSSLDLLAHVFGVPGSKDDMDGSMVAKVYYEMNDLPRIDAYCRKDVVTLAHVYCRFAGLPFNPQDIIFA